MKCFVDLITAKALRILEGKSAQPKLNDIQQKVQDVFVKFDFGCHNESVACMMEALTGHKPVKVGTTTRQLCEAVVSTSSARCIILGVAGGTVYGMSVDHPSSQGYFALNDSQIIPSSKATKKAIITAFSKFKDHEVMDFLMTKLAGQYPSQLLKALD